MDARVNIAAHPVAWPLSRLLRHAGPAVRVPGLGVVINGAELAHDILTDDTRFVKRGPGSIADLMTATFGPVALSNMDGDAHRQMRQRLGPLAAPDVAAAWLADAFAPFEHAARALEQGQRVDVAEASRLLAGHLTLTMLGVRGSDADAADVHRLGERIASALRITPFGQLPIERARADTARLVAMAQSAFRREDLPPQSLVARLRALGCDETETRGLLSIFFVAGALTLGVALPRVIGLLVDQQALHRLRDATAVQAAVDEAMRYAAPVPATVRIAAEHTELAGVRVRTGERLVILTANLARDPALFPQPDRFDPTRAPNPKARYLWYGAGPHFCIGFPMAQRVLHAAVTRLAQVPGPLRVTFRWPAHAVLLPAWRRLMVAPVAGRTL
jgi:cytochrome P450